MAHIAVHVNDSSENPIQGVTVSVSGNGWNGITDSGGNFDFGDVSPGDYTVTGREDDYWPQQAAQEQYAAAGTSTQYKLTLDPIQVSLTVQNPTLTLKHNNQSNLEVAVTPAGVAVDAYRIEIRRTSGTSWCQLTATFVLDPFTAKIAGNFKVRGVAKIQGQDKFSAEKDLTVQFPSYSDIAGDAAVVSATNQAWADTLSDCTASPNQRRERGFWIRLNTNTGNYEFTTTLTGPWCGPSDGAGVDLPSRPTDNPAAPGPCDTGATYSVASFHTHTSTEFRTVPSLSGAVRPIGPSGADNTSDTQDDVPGVVYDYIDSPLGSGSIPMGHLKSSAAKLYESLGKVRRTTPP